MDIKHSINVNNVNFKSCEMYIIVSHVEYVVKEMYASTLGSGIWYRKDLPSIIGTQQLEFIYP